MSHCKGSTMNILRRDFLKYCAGSAAALWLEFPTFGAFDKVLSSAAAAAATPTYPIAANIFTTLEQTVNPVNSPTGSFPPQPHYVPTIPPSDIAGYAANSYGEWNYVAAAGDVPVVPYLCPSMQDPTQNPPNIRPSVTDQSKCATLLTFFTMSDVHICRQRKPGPG